jgi:hypothetical protein
MTRSCLTLLVSLSILGAVPAAAQHPGGTSTPTEQNIKDRLVGTWTGDLQSDHLAGGKLKLVIAKDTAWSATLELTTSESIPTAALTDFKVDVDVVSWMQELMGMPCKTLAVLNAGILKGETNCGQGGFTFQLSRK